MRTYKKRLAYLSPRPHSHISLDWSETHPSNPMANKLLLFVQFVAIATIASCFTVADKRATGGYVQNTSGGASFTHYSGCSQPGMCANICSFQTPNVKPSFYCPVVTPTRTRAHTRQRAVSQQMGTPPP